MRPISGTYKVCISGNCVKASHWKVQQTCTHSYWASNKISPNYYINADSC